MNLHDVYAGLTTRDGWRLSMFSEDDIKRIHEATLYVLEKEGVMVNLPEALDIYEEGGCFVDRNRSTVKIPPHIVEHSTAQAPETVLFAGRDPKHDVIASGRNVGFEPFGVGLKVEDLDTGELRDSTLKDCADIIKVCDALDTVSIMVSPVMANDMPASNFELYMAAEGFKNSTKHYGSDAENGEVAEKLVDMGEILAGGSKELQERPLMSLAVCPVSPLKIPKEAAEVIIVAAKRGVPIEILSMAMAGATGPITMPGTLVVHNAEVLSGIVLAQLVTPGIACTYGSSTSTFDMKFGTATVGAPEFGMLNAALAEMAHFYEVPVTVGGL
jgi:trimethylamine---corrinoid protein Co-methyltransferase